MLRPLRTELVPRAEYLVYITDEFLEQLLTCHDDTNVQAAVLFHFKMIVAKIEVAGPMAGQKWVKKLESHGSLGEARYNTDHGVAWRFFFKFAWMDGVRVAVFADMDSKSRQDFPRSRYERAARAVDAALVADGLTEARVW
jgi:hypothetical protein